MQLLKIEINNEECFYKKFENIRQFFRLWKIFDFYYNKDV